MRDVICVNTSSFGDDDKAPIVLLETTGFEIRYNPFRKKLTKEQVMDFCKDALAIIAGTEVFDAKVLNHCSRLKVISRCGVGMDAIDHEAARRLGIRIFNTPDAPTDAVAELTVGLILNLLRKITQMDIAMKNGQWQKMMGNLLHFKRVGIIGYGRIGRRTAQLLQHFGCEVAYTDPCPADSTCGHVCLPLHELLLWADIISLHVPTGEEIIGKTEFALMKHGAFLVNVSRGGVVDEALLYEYLRNGALAGAALDVFEKEPYNGPLTELSNVILTPHIGSYARESRIDMEMQAAKNLLQGLREVNNK